MNLENNKYQLCMQQISIHIPDAQVSFMMELLQKFDFVEIDTPVDKGFTLSVEQKACVELERTKSKNDPDYLLDWDTVQHTLIVD
jgi:bifunctional pyridoxal-dependent enzyme with beta-cystathionase and maltose regulon repressor activities